MSSARMGIAILTDVHGKHAAAHHAEPVVDVRRHQQVDAPRDTLCIRSWTADVEL